MLHRFIVSIESNLAADDAREALSNLLAYKSGVAWSNDFKVEPMAPAPAKPEIEEQAPAQKVEDGRRGAANLFLHSGAAGGPVGIKGLSEICFKMGIPDVAGMKIPENFLGFGDVGGRVFSLVQILSSIHERLVNVEAAITGIEIDVDDAVAAEPQDGANVEAQADPEPDPDERGPFNAGGRAG